MKKRNEATSLETFPQMLQDQQIVMAEYLSTLTQEDLSEMLDLFNT
jgi:hypothetical protein